MTPAQQRILNHIQASGGPVALGQKTCLEANTVHAPATEALERKGLVRITQGEHRRFAWPVRRDTLVSGLSEAAPATVSEPEMPAEEPEPQEHELSTKIGSFHIKAIGEKQVWIAFDNMRAFGVEYQGWFHMNDYGSGLEPLRQYPDRPESVWSALWATRKDGGGKCESTPAKQKMMNEISEAARAWQKRQRAEFIRAERLNIRRAIERLQGEAKKLNEEAALKQREASLLESKLREYSV